MKKTNIKKLIPRLLTTTLIVATCTMLGQITGYATGAIYLSPISRNICTLMVKPYNSSKNAITDPSIGDKYINYLNNVCSKFVTYGSAYSPQPPKVADNPLNAAALQDNPNLPITRHDHRYYNDDDAQKDAFYHKAFMDRFEITVQSDGFNSIKLDQIQCQTPYPIGYDTSKMTAIEDCDGTLSDLWGGTTVSKKTVGNTFVITWDFGQTPQNGSFLGRPVIWGNNGSNFPEGNFTSDTTRNIEFNVHLPSKDNNGSTWSATTTSRTLIAHLAINKTHYPALKDKGCAANNDVNDPASGWCYLDPDPQYPAEQVFSSTNHLYYWFPVGSVATVWEKATPAPANICQNITTNIATYKTNTIDINGQTAYPLNVNNMTFGPDASIPTGATVTYTSSDPTGQFYNHLEIKWLKLIINKPLGTGSFTTSTIDKFQTVYYVGNSGATVTAKVTGLTAAQDSPTCQQPFTIPAPVVQNICQNITTNIATYKTNTIDINGQTAYPINVSKITFGPNSSIPTGSTVTYTSSDPTGQFYSHFSFFGISINKVVGTGSFTTSTTNKYQTVYYIGNSGATVTAKVTGLTAAQDSQTCQQPFIIPTPPLVCLNLTGIILEELDPTTELNTANWVVQLGPNNVYDLVSGINPNDINLKPNTVTYSIDPNYGAFLINFDGATSTKPFVTVQQTKPEGLKKDTLAKWTIGSTITVAPNTKVYFVIYSDAPNNATPIKDILKIQGSDSNAPLCNNSFPFLTPAPKVCTSITPTITGLNAGQLEKNKIYNDIKTDLLPIDASPNSITYKIDANYGAFIDTKNLDAIKQILVNTSLLGLQSSGQLSLVNLQALSTILSINIPISSQISSDNNATIILVTFSNVPNTEGLIPNILSIQGSNSSLAACNKTYPFYNPPQAKICSSLNVETANGTDFNGTMATTFNITGDYKNHPGTIQITSNSNGSISKIDAPAANPIIFTPNEIQKNDLKFNYYPDTYNKANPLSIIVKAINPDNSDNANCIAQILVQPVVPPPTCEELGNCGGGGGGTINKPKFNKYAYDTTHIKNASTTLNINGTTPYVTYMTILNIGNDVKEATISDPSINNGQILHKDVGNGTTGTLTFQRMKIDLVNGNDDTTLFKTDVFRDSDISSKAGNFANYTDKATSESTNYAVYDCSSDTSVKTNSPCIDTGITKPSPDAFAGMIVASFKAGKNGNGITFKNLGSKANYQIVIKYQMSYDNGIDNDKCANLKQSKNGGCGEEFDNVAHYTSVKKSSGGAPYSGDSNLDSKGKAIPVKIIAICPYVLTRQGGDVFFHDLIDTGIDVSQCSEVKNCEGICLKPTPPPKPGTTSTGAGDTSATPLLLKNPSHDVCSLSNTSDNLTGYNDVLKNFSSSICELQADVSKAWTKQNITDSINANVTRLSRWDANLNGIDVLSTTDTLPSSPSGVFVKKGGTLTIKGSTPVNSLNGTISGYAIGNNNPLITSKVPAAQTYIIIGGDLHIQSNIVYNDSFLNYTNNKNIPSAAFIVIDGNITIDSNVTHLDGIFMAVDTDGKGNDGQVKADTSTDTNILNINGNLIGNVYDLFLNRHYAGDPLKDEGSINIHYDERILLNTPPGINELINLQQAIVPN